MTHCKEERKNIKSILLIDMVMEEHTSPKIYILDGWMCGGISLLDNMKYKVKSKKKFGLFVAEEKVSFNHLCIAVSSSVVW